MPVGLIKFLHKQKTGLLSAGISDQTPIQSLQNGDQCLFGLVKWTFVELVTFRIRGVCHSVYFACLRDSMCYTDNKLIHVWGHCSKSISLHSLITPWSEVNTHQYSWQEALLKCFKEKDNVLIGDCWGALQVPCCNPSPSITTIQQPLIGVHIVTVLVYLYAVSNTCSTCFSCFLWSGERGSWAETTPPLVVGAVRGSTRCRSRARRGKRALRVRLGGNTCELEVIETATYVCIHSESA